MNFTGFSLTLIVLFNKRLKVPQGQFSKSGLQIAINNTKPSKNSFPAVGLTFNLGFILICIY